MFNQLAATESLATDDVDLPDGVSDETMFEAACDLHEDHAHVHDIRDMSNTCDELDTLHDSVESFGVSKSLLSFVNKDGMLAAAIPAFAACEALENGADVGSAESLAALEGIVGKSKDIAAAWFK